MKKLMILSAIVIGMASQVDCAAISSKQEGLLNQETNTEYKQDNSTHQDNSAHKIGISTSGQGTTVVGQVNQSM